MTLRPIVPDEIWHSQQPVKFGPFQVTTRMTVVRLASGDLWVHSPIEPTSQLVRQICELGPVAFVVAPNNGHHLFFLPFLEAFPGAKGAIAPGLAEKRPELSKFPTIQQLQLEWGPSLESFFIEGFPLLNETVWYHPDSRTLILTDLLVCIHDVRGLGRLIAKAVGVHKTLAMSHTMKLLVRDRRSFRESVSRLKELDIDRIIVAHDQVIESDAKRQLERAFRWLD